jgi:hypothetical protein
MVSALMGVGGCRLPLSGGLGADPCGPGYAPPHATAPSAASPIVSDNTSEIVSLNQLPILGGGESSQAFSEFAQVVRGWGDEHADVYAGEFLANGHLYVGLAKNPAAYLVELRQLVPRPEAIRAVRSQYTMQELQSGMTKLTADRDALKSRGIQLSSYGPDEYHDRLQVMVARLSPEVAASLRDHYGGGILSLSEGMVCAVAG